MRRGEPSQGARVVGRLGGMRSLGGGWGMEMRTGLPKMDEESEGREISSVLEDVDVDVVRMDVG